MRYNIKEQTNFYINKFLNQLLKKITFLSLLQIIFFFLMTIIGICCICLIDFSYTSPYFFEVDSFKWNIFFFLHVSVAIVTFTFFAFSSIIIIINIYFRDFYTSTILTNCNYITIYCSLFTLISGIAWGIYSWGYFVYKDPRVYLLGGIILFCSLYDFFFIKKSINFFNNFFIYLILFFILFLIPSCTILIVWLVSYHQSTTLNFFLFSYPYNIIIYIIFSIFCVFCTNILYLLYRIYILLIVLHIQYIY